MGDEHSWDLHLPTILLAYRTSIHETTGVMPFKLMFGQEARVPERDLLSSNTCKFHTWSVCKLKQRLSDVHSCVRLFSQRQQDHQKDCYDQQVRGQPYAIGDTVMVHEPAVSTCPSCKSHRPWKGPHRVIRVLGPTVYCIQDCTHPRRKRLCTLIAWNWCECVTTL